MVADPLCCPRRPANSGRKRSRPALAVERTILLAVCHPQEEAPVTSRDGRGDPAAINVERQPKPGRSCLSLSPQVDSLSLCVQLDNDFACKHLSADTSP